MKPRQESEIEDWTKEETTATTRLLQDEEGEPLQDGTIIEIRKDDHSFLQFRYCRKCKSLKPPRTHHCSVCGKCVMRMDHHCPWMGNCVALRTHKFFMCYLFWTCMATLHVAVSSIWLEVPFKDQSMQVGSIYLNSALAQMLGMGVTFAVGIMLTMHLTLIGSNTSTLEFAELAEENPYDSGCAANFK